MCIYSWDVLWFPGRDGCAFNMNVRKEPRGFVPAFTCTKQSLKRIIGNISDATRFKINKTWCFSLLLRISSLRLYPFKAVYVLVCDPNTFFKGITRIKQTDEQIIANIFITLRSFVENQHLFIYLHVYLFIYLLVCVPLLSQQTKAHVCVSKPQQCRIKKRGTLSVRYPDESRCTRAGYSHLCLGAHARRLSECLQLCHPRIKLIPDATSQSTLNTLI